MCECTYVFLDRPLLQLLRGVFTNEGFKDFFTSGSFFVSQLPGLIWVPSVLIGTSSLRSNPLPPPLPEGN